MKHVKIHRLTYSVEKQMEEIQGNKELESLELPLVYDVNKEEILKTSLSALIANNPQFKTLKFQVGGYVHPEIKTKSIVPLLQEIFFHLTPKLTHLGFDFITHPPIDTKDADEIAGLLSVLPSIESFQLKRTITHPNTPSAENFSFALLSQALQQLKHLKELSLSLDLNEAQQAEALLLISRSAKLISLKLADMKLSLESIMQLSTQLKNKGELVSLALPNTQLNDEALNWLLPNLMHVLTLDLSKNFFSENNFLLLANGLKHTQIISLNLKQSNLTDISFQILISSLVNMPSLSVLNCQSNALTVKSSPAIVSLIKANSSLRELHLGANKLGCDGFEAIVEALPENNTLQYLDLAGNNTYSWRNPWERNGGIIRGYKILSSDLTEKSIGKEGFITLSKALPNIHLTQLNIEENEADNVGLKALRAVINKEQAEKLFCGKAKPDGTFFNSHLLNDLFGFRSEIPEGYRHIGTMHFFPANKTARTDDQSELTTQIDSEMEDVASTGLAAASSSNQAFASNNTFHSNDLIQQTPTEENFSMSPRPG